MGDVLVVASKVKETVKKSGCNTSGDFITALSACCEECVKKAVERAKANGRKTVQSRDC